MSKFTLTQSSLTLLVLLLVTSHGVRSQSNAELIPNIAPPTPDVTQIGRFGNYPVSHFTGLADINIPIYEIRSGELSLPISLTYHTAGIKVTDRPGWVGLGWALQAGGVISRTVMGLPDESSAGYFSVPLKQSFYTNNHDDLNYLYEVNHGIKDAEPDLFSYSFAGVSGKFLFDQSGSNNPIMVPYEPLKITKTNSNNSLTFDAFDAMGTNYKFSTTFESSSGINDNVSVRSAWMLSEIVARNKLDKITLNYSSSSGTTYTDISDIFTINDDVSAASCGTGGLASDYGTTNVQNISVFSTEQKLANITFPLGKIEFVPATREDGYTGQKRLDQIKIYRINPATQAYVLSKTIQFYQTYFVSSEGTKRLRLDSFEVLDSQGTQIEEYSFDYNTTNLPDFLSRKRDYWGYYNGKANSTLVPRMDIPWVSGYTQTTRTIGGAINGRSPDQTYMQANILTKVTYPTGGWTEFDYETNRYLDNGVETLAGGLRVKQMRSYDGVKPDPVVKTYKYGSGETGIGRKNFILNNYFFQNTLTRRAINICTCEDASVRTRNYFSMPNISIEPYDGSPVVYPVVTVYDGDENVNNGKTVYTYQDYFDNLGSGTQIGLPAVQSYQFKRGLLKYEEVYKNNGGSYSLVHKTSNTYSAFPDNTLPSMGLKVLRVKAPVGDGPLYETDACDENDAYAFQYNLYSVVTGDQKLTSTSEITYSSDAALNTFSTSKAIVYGNFLHQQPTEITITNGLGETYINTIKYPHESTGTVYSEMVSKNMFAFPVEETNTRNGVQQVKTTHNYYKFSTYVYQPITIYRQIETGANDLEVTFTGYDTKGNALGYVARNGIQNSILWGYQNLLPIAMVSGAASNKISYTSFEESTASAVTTAQAKTGTRSWYNSAYTVTLPSAGTYKLTYWKKVGSGVWNYIVTTVSGNTSIGGSGIYVDEVRLYPQGAKMKTYTYDPGYGATYLTDMNSMPNVFEYDAFGRLAATRDYNGDVVKTYMYNFKKADQ